MQEDALPHVEKDDERIDEFGRYFFCVVAKQLDSVLQYAIIGPSQRRTICALFCDNLATFVDAGWIQAGQERLWPVLGFAQRAPDTECSVGDLLRIFIPSSESFLSEGGSEGAVAFHFEQDAQAKELMSFNAGLRGDEQMTS
jgi:hypothetical protein